MPREIDASAPQSGMRAEGEAHPTVTDTQQSLTPEMIRLVLAARHVAFVDQEFESLHKLDKASEAFAAVVPWDDDPNNEAADVPAASPAAPSSPAPTHLVPDKNSASGYSLQARMAALPKPAPDAMRSLIALVLPVMEAAAAGRSVQLAAADVARELRAYPSAPVSPPDGAAEDQYRYFVIRKNGYFYRANACGYYADIEAAGRFTYEEAEKLTMDVEGAALHRVEEFLSPPPPDDVRSALADKIEGAYRWAHFASDGSFVEALSPEDQQKVAYLLRSAPVSGPAVASDEDWETALRCAMSCLRGVAINKPQLDNAMQHAFGILALRKSAPVVGETREAVERAVFDALPATGDDKVPWSWDDTLSLANRDLGVDTQMAKSQIAEVRKISDAILALRSPVPDETVSEPDAWEYEIATRMSAEKLGEYSGWKKQITDYKPNVPEKSIRNLAALYRSSPQHVGREATVSARDAVIEDHAKLARQFELDMSRSQLDDRDIELIQRGANEASEAIASLILSSRVKEDRG